MHVSMVTSGVTTLFASLDMHYTEVQKENET